MKLRTALSLTVMITCGWFLLASLFLENNVAPIYYVVCTIIAVALLAVVWVKKIMVKQDHTQAVDESDDSND